MRRMASHANGIALIFARTETALFFETVWERASAVLFLRGRLFFHRPDGRQASANAGAPSCLVAYGATDASTLERCGIEGHFVALGAPQRQHPAEWHGTLWETSTNDQAGCSRSHAAILQNHE
jgi:hypothetical protein